MRIVGGRHRGRKVRVPQGLRVRPTADRAREALFDILLHHRFDGGFEIEGARVADVFCGTGALGFEALSRGAAHATFLDSDRAVLALARENAAALGEEAHVSFILADAIRPPKAGKPCALVFLDPPYGSGLAPPALVALARQGWLADGALAVVEIGAKDEFAPPAGFEVVDERRYGAGRIVILTFRPP